MRAEPSARPGESSSALPVRPAVRRGFSLLYVVPLVLLLSPYLVAPLVGRLRAIR
jgi:hypothetical protein